jgi:hypothetical protein
MRVAKPLPLTLISINVADSALSEWSAGTTYATGARVKVTSASWPFREYESLADANTGNVPVATPSKWLDLGPINRHSMFDDRTGTVTTNAAGIDVTVAPGAVFDTIALLNLSNVSSVDIIVTRGGETIFSTSESTVLDFETSEDFYPEAYVAKYRSAAYSAAPYSAQPSSAQPIVADGISENLGYRDSLVFRREVFYSDAHVRLKLNGSNVGCGHCMVAKSVILGDAQYGLTTPFEDYSTKETDDFGTTYLLQRGFSKKLSVNIAFKTSQYDAITRRLASLRATPALWDANGDDTQFESLVVFGFLESVTPTLSYFSESHCAIDVEGLI